jgi:hypothetical protein
MTTFVMVDVGQIALAIAITVQALVPQRRPL